MTGARVFGWVIAGSLLCVSATSAFPQSLAEVARKEKARRDKNEKEGVAAKEFSETEIFGEEPAPGDPDAADSLSDPVASESGDPIEVDVRPENETTQSPKASSERARDESEWRSRLAGARARVAEARKRKGLIDALHYVPGMTFVDERGNVVIRSLAELKALVEATDQEVSDAEGALADLIETARRAGVPPGWLR